MPRRKTGQITARARGKSLGGGGRSYRPRFDPLEIRQLLDSGLAAQVFGDGPGLVVGRTLSTYTVDGVEDGQVTIRYTVYNQQADPLTGVELSTTLQAGVSLASASLLPSTVGSQLSWSLGTLDGFSQASVSITVSLDGAATLVLDGGSEAAGVLHGQNVTDFAPAASLRADTIAPELLAATADANANDPFIQEKAAELDYDPQRIFDFLRTDIGYESYIGSLRGALGTLWSGAGNALDEASLGVALMRASGIPARYVEGTLSDDLSRQLVLSMFPDPLRVQGYVEATAITFDPGSDPGLLQEARDHFWIAFDTGSGFQDADPGFVTAQIGQALATPTGTFAEVPDALRHKVTIRLDRELTSPGAGLLTGTSGQNMLTVLQQTFNTVDLIGKPITIGNFIQHNSVSAIFTFITNTYSPYLLIGQGDTDLADDPIIRGTDYQETLSSFPFSNQILTGLFLNIDLTDPAGHVDSYQRTLLDRIGFDVRQNGGTPNIQLDPNGAPALTEADLTTINVIPGRQSPLVAAAERERVSALQAELAALQPRIEALLPGGPTTPQQLADFARSTELIREIALSLGETTGEVFALLADGAMDQLENVYLSRAYDDSPRLILAQTKVTNGAFQIGLDVLRNDARVLPFPGQIASAGLLFEFARGMIESDLEGQAVSLVTGQPATSVTDVLGAMAAGNEMVALTPDNIDEVSGLALSAEAKARITSALQQGKSVLTPSHMVTVNGKSTVAWLETDWATGHTISVAEDGTHFALAEYAAVISGVLVNPQNIAISAFIGTINGMGIAMIAFTGDLLSGLVGGLTLEEAVRQAKTDITQNIINRYAADFLGNAAAATGNAADLGPIGTSALLCLANLVNPFAAHNDGLLTMGKCLLDLVERVTGLKTLETALKGGILVGMAAAVQWISFNFPGDPAVFPYLSAPLSPDPPVVTPGSQPGVHLQVIPEPLLYYPFNGTQLHSVFKAQIQNLGPDTATYHLAVTGLPAGFEALTSLSDVTIPAGHTAEIGVIIRPTSGPLPLPGTVIPFTVVAQGSSVSATADSSFTIDQVHGVTLDLASSIAASPGATVTTTLTVAATGNVPETVDLAANLPAGIDLDGLPGSVSLARGEVRQIPLSFKVAPSVAVNQELSVLFTTDVAGIASLYDPSQSLRVSVRSAEAAAVEQVGLDAIQAGRLDLASALSDLAETLGRFQANPSDATQRSRLDAELVSLGSLLSADAGLAGLSSQVDTVRQQLAANNPPGVVSGISGLLPDLSVALALGLSLSPASIDLQPGQGTELTVTLTNRSADPLPVALALGSLPDGVDASLAETDLILAPGETHPVALTLNQSIASTKVFNLSVTATAGRAMPTVSTVIAVRPAFADVLSVSATPSTVESGDPVTVSARIFNAANAERVLVAHVEVLDPTGAVMATLADVPVHLLPQSEAVDVTLGSLVTTGLANGLYGLRVAIRATDGGSIPGRSAQAPLLVGAPVSATISASPLVLPPGSSTVTTTVDVANTGTADSGGGTGSGNGNSGTITFDFYYSRYATFESIRKATATYDGTTFTIDSKSTIASGVPADGLIFLPNGNLLTADNTVTQVDPVTGAKTSVSGRGSAEHLALDPSGTKVWTSGQPGGLIEIPLEPFADGIAHPLQGDDTVVSSLAFDEAGIAYYATGGPFGFGAFGIIDLTTFTTHRILSNLPAAHGISFDPYTGDLLLYGSTHITQIDPRTLTVVSDISFPNTLLDQGAPDGQGHVFVADNRGLLVFVDYAASGLVGDPSNFTATPFLDSNADDVAPLSGLGALGTSLTVTHGLPSTGYTADPTSVHPSTSSSSTTQLIWNSVLPQAATTPSSFQVSGQVAGLVPGETREISTGTDVTVRVGGTVGVPTPVDLSTWSVVQLPQGLQPPGNWVLSDNNTKATQVVNADPSILLSNFDVASDRIDGTFRVNSGADDDFIGFVFGYQDTGHFYLFDWKQSDQNDNGYFAERGMSVKVVSASTPLKQADLWPTAGQGDRVRTLYHNTVTYQDFTDYAFTIDFHAGEFTITVKQGATTLASFTVNDSTYADGKFGFYNYSQEQVVYAGFTRAALPDLPFTIHLPAVVVAGQHIIGLDPAEQAVLRGGTVTYQVRLDNPLPTDVTYNLDTTGLDGLNVVLPPSMLVPAGQTVLVPMTVTVPMGNGPGTRGFTVQATTDDGVADSAEGRLDVSSETAQPVLGVLTSLTPSSAVAGQGNPATYKLRVTNTGNAVDTYTLSGAFPAGFNASFDSPTITVAPGASNAYEVTLTLTPPPGTPVGSLPFSVTTQSATSTDVSSTVSGTIQVVASGVSVGLSPPTGGKPGDPYVLTVTNTGQISDTFDLSLAGPAALASSLAVSQVTLAPGASQQVPVTVSPIDFAPAGTLLLVGLASSHANPTVRDAASAEVKIADRLGLTAEVSPSVKVLPLPGTTSFLLVVTNPGTSEQAYTASITGTTGPLTAAFVASDGQSSPSLNLFRLPGLTSGSLLIETNLTEPGQGTFSVQVQSLDHPQLSATDSATVAADVATTTTLIPSATDLTTGQPVTFTAVVASEADGMVPLTGSVTFTIDGQDQAPVPVQLVDGQYVATFTTTSLGVGIHNVTASYGNDPIFSPSTSLPAQITVRLPSGPRVISLLRYGYHWMPTTLVLRFDRAVDAATAQNARNYQILGPRGQFIPVLSASYDAATNTLILQSAQRLNVHYPYTLIVNGSTAAGLKDLQGNLLDGNNDGRAGGNYTAIVDFSKLVFGSPPPITVTPRPVRHPRPAPPVRPTITPRPLLPRFPYSYDRY